MWTILFFFIFFWKESRRRVRLVLIRHGESANRGRGGRPADEDPALSDRGAAQAAALADSPLVASLAGATVVSSPMFS